MMRDWQNVSLTDTTLCIARIYVKLIII